MKGRLEPDRGALWRRVAVGAGLAGVLAGSCWATLRPLIRDWTHDQDYSVGMLVPAAAVYLAWENRSRLAACRLRPCWWGAVVVVLAMSFRAYAMVTLRESVERYAMVLAIPGVVLLVAGTEVFRRAFWILLLLFLMVPLPTAIHNQIAGPLQQQASSGAAFVLELMGVMIQQEGTVITLRNMQQVNVEEACSGLRMLTAFIVVAYVLACVVDRPKWQRAVLVVSSIPVAIVCNLVRLVITTLLFIVASGRHAEWFFHEAGGWAMMVLAVFILVGELWLMARLVTGDEHERVATEM